MSFVKCLFCGRGLKHRVKPVYSVHLMIISAVKNLHSLKSSSRATSSYTVRVCDVERSIFVCFFLNRCFVCVCVLSLCFSMWDSGQYLVYCKCVQSVCMFTPLELTMQIRQTCWNSYSWAFMYTHSCYVGEYHFLNFFLIVLFLCHLLPVCYCTTLKGNLSARGSDPLCECSEFDMPCCT